MGEKNNSIWQTFKNKILFVELGHCNLSSMSRHDIVDLIDDCISDYKIDKLIFYYNKNRSDIKNLNKIFKIMDFEFCSYLITSNYINNEQDFYDDNEHQKIKKSTGCSQQQQQNK